MKLKVSKKNKLAWRKKILTNAIFLLNNRVNINNDVFIDFKNKKNYSYGVEYRNMIFLLQDDVNYSVDTNILGLLFLSIIATVKVEWRYRISINDNLKNSPELAVILSLFTKEQVRKMLISSLKMSSELEDLNLTDRQEKKLKNYHKKFKTDKDLCLSVLNNVLKHNGNFDLH